MAEGDAEIGDEGEEDDAEIEDRGEEDDGDDDGDDDDDEKRTKKSRRRRHRAGEDEVTHRQPHVTTVDHPDCKAVMISNKVIILLVCSSN